MPGDELRAETTLTYGADGYAYAADAGVACTEGTATEGKRFADKDQKGADRLTDLSHPEHKTPVAMLSGNDNSVRTAAGRQNYWRNFIHFFIIILKNYCAAECASRRGL